MKPENKSNSNFDYNWNLPIGAWYLKTLILEIRRKWPTEDVDKLTKGLQERTQLTEWEDSET